MKIHHASVFLDSIQSALVKLELFVDRDDYGLVIAQLEHLSEIAESPEEGAVYDALAGYAQECYAQALLMLPTA